MNPRGAGQVALQAQLEEGANERPSRRFSLVVKGRVCLELNKNLDIAVYTVYEKIHNPEHILEGGY